MYSLFRFSGFGDPKNTNVARVNLGNYPNFTDLPAPRPARPAGGLAMLAVGRSRRPSRRGLRVEPATWPAPAGEVAGHVAGQLEAVLGFS